MARDWRSELEAIRQAQRAKHPPQAGARSDPGHSRERRIIAGSSAALLRSLAAEQDSSASLLCAENADLVVLQHAYGAGRGMDAWVTSAPRDRFLRLRLLIATSRPKRDRSGLSRSELHREWARTTVYVCRISAPEKLEREMRFDVLGHPNPPDGYRAEQPCYATASPVIDIEIEHAGPVVRIEGWPAESAGVSGYVERRRTDLYL